MRWRLILFDLLYMEWVASIALHIITFLTTESLKCVGDFFFFPSKNKTWFNKKCLVICQNISHESRFSYFSTQTDGIFKKILPFSSRHYWLYWGVSKARKTRNVKNAAVNTTSYVQCKLQSIQSDQSDAIWLKIEKRYFKL